MATKATKKTTAKKATKKAATKKTATKKAAKKAPKKVAAKKAKKATTKKTPTAAAKATTQSELFLNDDAIAAKAYEIYLERQANNLPGDESSDWFEAVKSLRNS